MLTRKFHSFKLVSCFMLALERKLSMAEGKYYPISFPIAAQEQEAAAAAKKKNVEKEKKSNWKFFFVSSHSQTFRTTIHWDHYTVCCVRKNRNERETQKKVERQLVNCNMKSWQSPKKKSNRIGRRYRAEKLRVQDGEISAKKEDKKKHISLIHHPLGSSALSAWLLPRSSNSLVHKMKFYSVTDLWY